MDIETFYAIFVTVSVLLRTSVEQLPFSPVRTTTEIVMGMSVPKSGTITRTGSQRHGE